MSKGNGRSSNSILGMIPVLVAVMALIFFGIELYYMQGLIAAGVPDPQWSRAAYLFASVEAIAFAAAGFLFGREVNRQRAERAEAHSDKAQEEAGEAQTTAAAVVAKAQSLREMANLKAGGQNQRTTRYVTLGAQAETATHAATQSDLEELAELAKRLFPSAEELNSSGSVSR